jgi:hypothetical protein
MKIQEMMNSLMKGKYSIKNYEDDHFLNFEHDKCSMK